MTVHRLECGACFCPFDSGDTCPHICTKCKEQVCPDCGSLLTDESTNIDFCGPGCKVCGWHHCGDCAEGGGNHV